MLRRGLLALLLAMGMSVVVPNTAAPPPQPRDERSLLLQFTAGISNWAEVKAARRLVGWSPCLPGNCTPVCTWGGIQCDPYVNDGDSVTQLDLNCHGASCKVPLAGRLVSGLQELPYLQRLDLSSNNLSGTLPVEWGNSGSFPALIQLTLHENQLTGNMPDSWSIGPAFLQLVDLQLASNQFSGSFPPLFALTNTSFINVLTINFADNKMTGTLPSYINGFITMNTVALQDNMFTGTLPPDWGMQGFAINGGFNNTQALENLYLHGNKLHGTLPATWGNEQSFRVLKQLTLSGNPLDGGLPPEWGAKSWSLPEMVTVNLSSMTLTGTLPAGWGPGLQSLEILDLAGNSLSGNVPASWAQMSSLQQVVLQPGNPDFCTELPSGAKFSLCGEGDPLCLEKLAVNPATCTAQPSSSFPVAAVAVPVTLVCIGLLALAGFMLWRQQRRRKQTAAGQQQQQQQHSAGSKDLHWQDSEVELGLSGDDGCGMSSRAASGAQDPAHMHSSASSWCCLCASCADEPAPLSSGTVQQHSSSGASPGTGDSGASHSQPAVISSRQGSGGSGPGLELPAFTEKELQVVLSDWQIPAEDIQIMKRADGSDWQLGSGGFGTVYKALQNGVQPVAVKVLGSAVSNVKWAMSDADFGREISILRACRDSNVLQFQGACFQNGRTLLVTEYMEGGSLAQNLRAKRVNWWRRGKKIAVEVAKALVYLHSRRIIHLDIKSANVLLTRDGTAKVGDVGMAKIMQGDYVSAVLGTLAWSAPELLMGKRCTTKADIFSFGMVLWEIVTQELPVRGQFRDPEVPEECPPELAAIMYRCLRVEPAERPTAVELVELLQAIPVASASRATSLPLSTPPESASSSVPVGASVLDAAAEAAIAAVARSRSVDAHAPLQPLRSVRFSPSTRGPFEQLEDTPPVPAAQPEGPQQH